MHDSNTNDDNAQPNTEGSYTWAGSFPYTKEELPGRKTDEDSLASSSKIKKMSQIDTSRVAINVVDQIVSITGSAQTYEQKRRVGKKFGRLRVW